ncbi:MAG: TQO small subunit DoxD [Bacteroidales bacterium]
MENSSKFNHKLFSTILFGLRMMSGWLFLSAFLRRVVLAPEKLDPSSLEYVGIKFNTFLPHAVGIQPMLEYLLTHGDLLFVFLIVFTIIEGLCGLGLMLGFFTRLTALGTTCLSFGILLGAGWLGSTCLDEWQIGVSGVACGLTLIMAGSGYYSLDNLIFAKYINESKPKWIVWITSGRLPISDKAIKQTSFWIGIVAIFITLWSNQILHGGVWGKLFNWSKKPFVEVSETSLRGDNLSFDAYRTNGSDVSGAFVIELIIADQQDRTVWKYDFPHKNYANMTIDNIYISKIRTGKYSLEIPLGAKANIQIKDSLFRNLSGGEYELKLIDVGGEVWKQSFVVEH